MRGAFALDWREAAGRALSLPTPQAEVQIGCLSVFDAGALSSRLPQIVGAPVQTLGAVLAEDAVTIEQLGACISLLPGEWSLYCPVRPSRLVAPSRVRVVVLPRHSLGEGAAYLPSQLLDTFRNDQPINRLTYSVLSALCEDACGMAPGCGHEVALAAVHVLKSAIIERAGRRRSRDALLERIKDHVEWRLRDPELTIGQVARALNCTARNVHRAFRAQGETLGRYVLRLRLERCRRDLMAPELAHQSVTEIAFSYGFNNLAHFSRAYKELFGQPPSLSRSAASAGDGRH